MASTLKEYEEAKQDIQKLEINEKNCLFFQVNTKEVKEALIQRANEISNAVLNKCSEVCLDNINRINDFY